MHRPPPQPCLAYHRNSILRRSADRILMREKSNFDALNKQASGKISASRVSLERTGLARRVNRVPAIVATVVTFSHAFQLRDVLVPNVPVFANMCVMWSNTKKSCAQAKNKKPISVRFNHNLKDLGNRENNGIVGGSVEVLVRQRRGKTQKRSMRNPIKSTCCVPLFICDPFSMHSLYFKANLNVNADAKGNETQSANKTFYKSY